MATCRVWFVLESALRWLQMHNRALVGSLAVAVLALAAASMAGQRAEERTADGHPDIEGYYLSDAPSATHSLEEGEEPENALGRGRRTRAEIDEALKNRKIMLVDPAPGPTIPYQPWARAKRRELLDAVFAPTTVLDIEPEDRCALQGVPRSNYRSEFQIMQTPGMVTIQYAWNHAYRTIPLDGRPHIPAGIKLDNGDSRGHWEGNTLVVDVTNLDDQTWFDAHGTFHSNDLHVVERWTVVDANTIHYEATLDDPAVFARPWTMAFSVNRLKDLHYEVYEEACAEGNERSIEGTVEAGRALRAKGITGRHEHSPGFYDEK